MSEVVVKIWVVEFFHMFVGNLYLFFNYLLCALSTLKFNSLYFCFLICKSSFYKKHIFIYVADIFSECYFFYVVFSYIKI